MKNIDIGFCKDMYCVLCLSTSLVFAYKNKEISTKNLSFLIVQKEFYNLVKYMILLFFIMLYMSALKCKKQSKHINKVDNHKFSKDLENICKMTNVHTYGKSFIHH